MQLFVLILNRTEFLERILTKMLESGIGGATILESTGMMRILGAEDADSPMFGMLRHLLNPERQGNKTIFALLKEEQIPVMRSLIQEVTGGLDKPDTGIAFAVSTSFVEGLANSL